MNTCNQALRTAILVALFPWILAKGPVWQGAILETQCFRGSPPDHCVHDRQHTVGMLPQQRVWSPKLDVHVGCQFMCEHESAKRVEGSQKLHTRGRRPSPPALRACPRRARRVLGVAISPWRVGACDRIAVLRRPRSGAQYYKPSFF